MIKNETSTSVYIRGCDYYRDGKVSVVDYDPHDRSFEAAVLGSKRYAVRVELSEDNEIGDYECDCPAYYNYYSACKHVVAVMKAIQTDWHKLMTKGQINQLSRGAQELIQFFQHKRSESLIPEHQTNVNLIPTLCSSTVAGFEMAWLEFVIGIDRTYILKDVNKFLNTMLHGGEIKYGKQFTLRPQEMIFSPVSKQLLSFMLTTYKDEKQLERWNHGYYNPSKLCEGRKFKLTDTTLSTFFNIMGKHPFSFSLENSRYEKQKVEHVTVKQGRPPIQLGVQQMEGGFKLDLLQESMDFVPLHHACHYLYHDGFVYEVDELFSENIKPVINAFQQHHQSEITIPDSEASSFFSTVVPELEKISTLEVDETLSDRFYREPLQTKIYFDKESHDAISAVMEFHYGNTIINPILDTYAGGDEGRLLLRKVQEENELLAIFQYHYFEQNKQQFILSGEEEIFRFLQLGLPSLHQQAEVYYSDAFKQIKIRQSVGISAGIRLNEKSDMLELSIHLDDIDKKELQDLLSSYRLKKKYHRLKSGAFIPLESDELHVIGDLVDNLHLSAKEMEMDHITLSKNRALYIDSLTREHDQFHIERNSAFKQMVQDIREPQDLDFALPEGIQGELRHYQKVGFKWMKSLAHYGLGGILADDMGLGKTLQVITFLLSEKQQGNHQPSLVVVPTSLLYNWREEVHKFAPTLNVVIVNGQQNERIAKLQDLNHIDIVITSYGMLKRDMDYYRGISFQYCILDEAQHIKNPNTISAKSVKDIEARGFFALTGTPVENALTELWSIFDFLMPGYLLSHHQFVRQYEAPIAKKEDAKVLRELSRMIKPFILRRMKKHVLKELPDKMESKVVNEMSSEQAKVYNAFLLQAQQQLETEIGENGFEQSQIKILALLTRLRQICCHPSIFIDNYNGESGKLEVLKEMVKDAVSGGHRILIFSQYTSMLSLIQKSLQYHDLDYFYLDGRTKAEQRMNMVQAFNGGEKDIFLISLKAGGTGLNLTGADVVIHYDPWWNPAVEDQATDRAYRLGQTKEVQVYKLITKGTIEEKIYELQQKKKELIDAVIKPGENFISKMNEDEVRELFRV